MMDVLMNDSGTLTPPSSPSLDDFTRKRRNNSFPGFSCKGIVTATCNLSEEGYLRSGHFNRLLRNELDDFDSDDECCKFFEMTVAKSSIIDQFKSIIFMAKKHISMIRNKTQQKSVSFTCDLNLSECYHIRKYFFSFFHHIKVFIINLIHCNYESDFSTFKLRNELTVVLNEWRGLLLFLGRISDFPEHVINSVISSNGNKSTSKFHHLFHLYLDIWWSTIELLYIVDIIVLKNDLSLTVNFSRPVMPGCERFFCQVVLLLLWDLCFLAVNRHNNLSSDYQTETPFTCTCISEIWIMIIHILEYKQKQESKYFWNYMNYLFQRILLSSTLYEEKNAEIILDLFILEPESFHSNNPIGFCMWLLTHVTSLYKYDSIGNYIPDIKVQRNYSNIQSLINISLSSQLEKNDEAQLRCILYCCHLMCSRWETNMDIILPIIDFFLKKINESFQLKFGIQAMAFTNKSSQLWLEEIKEISLNREKIKLSDTNFQIFLRLLSLQLSKIGNDKNNFWKQIKGRIYTKFHSRRMKELSEIGLFNCFTLFLVLAHTTDLLDIGSKLCNLTTIIYKGNMGSNKQMISWKAAFTLMAIYQEHNIDISTITNICDQFNQVCINFSQNESHHTYIVLINTYFDGVQNIIQNSNSLTLSEYLLLEKGLDILLLKHCGNSHGPLLTTIEQLLKKLYSIFQINKHQDMLFNNLQLYVHDHHIKFFQVLCDYILPFLRGHVITSAPLPQSAFISAKLTYLSLFLKISDLKNKLIFSELFNFFGSDCKINADIICDYLCILLKEQEIISYLTKEHCSTIIKSWFRCCLCIIPPSEKMQELTQLLISLPEPANLLKHIDHNGKKHDDIFISFCCKFLIFSMEEQLSLKSTLQYVLQDFVLLLTELLKTPNTISKEMLSHIYNLCSHLIEYCAPFLYIKSKPDCILPSIIDAIILPRAIYAKNKVPLVLLELIREHMTSFISGLTKTNFCNDPYLRRKLKDIIIQYLPRFPVKSRENNFNIHPLLKSSLQLPNTIANDFIIFATEIIRDNFIKKGSSHFEHFSLSILFLNELLNRINPTYKQNLISKLLPFLLDQLILNGDLRNQLMEFILTLLKICEAELGLDFRKNFVLPSMQMFIENHLPWKTNYVFKIMQDIATPYPKLSIDLIPILIKQIQVIEEKRGVGLDQTLRHGLSLIIKKLDGYQQ